MSRGAIPYAKDMTKLFLLQRDIDTRVQSIRESHPDWLCEKACDSCCRRLAAVPRLSTAEWSLLQEGLAALLPAQLADIGQKMTALSCQQSGPVTCPLLDLSTGACLVYAQRPVACRTYGFYVQRDKGLYCHDIESRVADGALADVVWGNHDVIDQRLSEQGENRALTAWFACRERGK